MGTTTFLKKQQHSHWVTWHLLKQTPLDFIESRTSSTHSQMVELANLANKRKKKRLRMGHGLGRQPQNELRALVRRRPVARLSAERRGAQSTRMQCGAAASRRPRDVEIEALQERDKSRALAAGAELKRKPRCENKKIGDRWRRACLRRKSSGLRLK